MKTAYIFPGQGSQFVGMGKDLYEEYLLAKDRYNQANDILGFDLTRISFEGPNEELTQTNITQPALFVHSYIMFELYSAKNNKPDMVAGHSLGEYTAIAASGALDFETTLKLVKLRGELMKNAGIKSPGTMAAIIGLDYETTIKVCEKASKVGVVGIANLNSPGQLVISGSIEGIDAAIDLAKEAKAKRALKLNVSGAFHSPLMESATQDFSRVLTEMEFDKPLYPVYCNVSAQPTQDVNVLKEYLSKQLMSPVLWTKTIENMIANGATQFVELGPGTVLTGLLRRIDRTVSCWAVGSTDALSELIEG